MSLANGVTIKTSHYVIGAISLVAAINWQETIKKIFYMYFPSNSNLLASFINSFFITLILILVITILPDTTDELPSKVRKKVIMEEQKKKIEELEKKINGQS